MPLSTRYTCVSVVGFPYEGSSYSNDFKSASFFVSTLPQIFGSLLIMRSVRVDGVLVQLEVGFTGVS